MFHVHWPVLSLWNWTAYGALTKESFFSYWCFPVTFTMPDLNVEKRRRRTTRSMICQTRNKTDLNLFYHFLYIWHISLSDTLKGSYKMSLHHLKVNFICVIHPTNMFPWLVHFKKNVVFRMSLSEKGRTQYQTYQCLYQDNKLNNIINKRYFFTICCFL